MTLSSFKISLKSETTLKFFLTPLIPDNSMQLAGVIGVVLSVTVVKQIVATTSAIEVFSIIGIYIILVEILLIKKQSGSSVVNVTKQLRIKYKKMCGLSTKMVNYLTS